MDPSISVIVSLQCIINFHFSFSLSIDNIILFSDLSKMMILYLAYPCFCNSEKIWKTCEGRPHPEQKPLLDFPSAVFVKEFYGISTI